MVFIKDASREIKFTAKLENDRNITIILTEVKPNIFKLKISNNTHKPADISVYELFLIIVECFNTFEEVLTIDIGYYINKGADFDLTHYLIDFTQKTMASKIFN